MSRLKLLAVAAAAGAAVSGCAANTGALTAANNPSLSSMHQPIVQRTDFVLDLATGSGGVPPSELDRLDAWFDSIGAGYGDRIAIDEPHGYANAPARADVARVAADRGLLLAHGAPVLNGVVQPGTVRIVVSRATASVPGCPLWDDEQIMPNVNTSANFGCATNSNLAAMVANPEDLVHGQEGGIAGSATTAGRAVRSYRERPPTGREGLPSTSTTGND